MNQYQRQMLQTTGTARPGERRRGCVREVHRRQSGFSMIELMIVLIVAALLLSIGAPSFVNLVADNRSVAAVYDLRSALDTARSEALAQRAFVTFCPSTDGVSCGGTWGAGYVAFVDFDGDAVVDTGGADNDTVVLSQVGAHEGLQITFNGGGGTGRVRFDPAGTALNRSGSFVVCDQRGATKARALFLADSGQARSLQDTDDNQVPNLPAMDGGGDVSCP